MQPMEFDTEEFVVKTIGFSDELRDCGLAQI